MPFLSNTTKRLGWTMHDASASSILEALSDPEQRPKAYARLLECLQTNNGSDELRLAVGRDLKEGGRTTARGFRALSVLFELDASQTVHKVLQAAEATGISSSIESLCVDVAGRIFPQAVQEVSAGLAHQPDHLLLEQQLAFAQLLSTAASHSAARHLLSALHAESWLEAALRHGDSFSELHLTSATALSKLLFTQTSQKPESLSRLAVLAQLLCDALAQLSEPSSSPLLPVIAEGLAILTLLPKPRKALFNQDKVVHRLCEPRLILPSSSTQGSDKPLPLELLQVQFSIACVLANITTYKPPTSPEESSERLRQLSLQAENSSQAAAASWEPDSVIHHRCQLLTKYGICSILDPLVRSRSLTARRRTGVALANLTCLGDTRHRGSLLQQGAAIMFLNLARQEPSTNNQPKGKEPLHPDFLLTVQGFARLLITANPALALAPQLQLEAIRVLSVLFVAQEASLLQIFEATMALTNLCSLSEEARTHFTIAIPSTLTQLDAVMLYDGDASNGHMMCRRAATQLACNLTMCEAGFAHFAGSASVSTTEAHMPNQEAQTRLHLLLALSDISDVDTRMAASACLALLTISSDVCCFLLDAATNTGDNSNMANRTIQVLQSLIQERLPGLRERGLACISNVIQRLPLLHLDSRKLVISSGWKSALGQLQGAEAADVPLLMARLDAVGAARSVSF